MFNSNIINNNITNNIINSSINKQTFNVTKNILTRHSFNKVYDPNILNKRKPKVIQHIFASNFVFDLSCGNTFELKKNIIRAAFQNNFCKELTLLEKKVKGPALVKKVKVQTVQFALHCSRGFIKPFLQNDISKIPAKFPVFLNIKAKANNMPCLRQGKRVAVDFFTLDLKLNNLSVLYKQKEQAQNKRNFLSGILKQRFVGINRPLGFIKAINEVFNKVIKKNRLCTPTWRPIKTTEFLFSKESPRSLLQRAEGVRTKSKKTKGENSLIATFQKPKKALFSSKAPLWSSLIFKNKKNSKLKTANKRLSLNKYQETEARWFTVSGGSSSLADQKRRSSQAWAAFSEALRGGGFFGGSLVRADWVLGRFIEQLGKKKMNLRAAINQQVNDIRVLIDKMGSECPIKGMRITITGRLGSRKKAMAQQISKCVGKVPLSTFKQKVDYGQGVLPTRFGLVGIKIWVCYGNDVS